MNAKKPAEIMDDPEFRNSVKNGNRMVIFGDDIRDKARLAYVEAAKRVEL